MTDLALYDSATMWSRWAIGRYRLRADQAEDLRQDLWLALLPWREREPFAIGWIMRRRVLSWLRWRRDGLHGRTCPLLPGDTLHQPHRAVDARLMLERLPPRLRGQLEQWQAGRLWQRGRRSPQMRHCVGLRRALARARALLAAA